MRLPFALDHINLWMLEDGDGWTLVDTGLADAPTRAQWEQVFAATLGARAVRRILVTHFHPDHAGNAGWLCERFGVPLWMTQGEYLTAHAVRAGAAGFVAEATLGLFRAPWAGRGAPRAAAARAATSTGACVRRAADAVPAHRRG